MIVIPFLYFTFMTLFWWKKHQGIDVCVYMSGLYAISSFFSIVIVSADLLGEGGVLFDDSDLELGVFPTLLFCTFLTLCILPFSMIYNKKIKRITATNGSILMGISLILIAVGLINLYVVADSTMEILSGDLNTIRTDHYNGIVSPAQIKAESLPAICRYLYVLNYATILALPLLFYYLMQKKTNWILCTLLLISSLSSPIAAFQTADRNEFVFYGMMFIFCFILFYKQLTRKIRRLIYIGGSIFCSIFLVYIFAVSIARFEERDQGASGSIIQYAGQGYLNFCYFWENANFEFIAPEREFPMIAHTVFKIDSDDYRRGVRSGQQGFFISVFPTFIGEIMLDLSPIGMVSWVIYYSLICFILLKTSEREEYDLEEIIMIFTLAALPTFGIFYYRYFYFSHSLITITAALIYLSSRFKISFLK
ncbi:MAG: oligosaccharide repeat unit polymerase [Prevotella sp.]|nr:oligosaccharide repeat unit polymerase [Prevotella sp.]